MGYGRMCRLHYRNHFKNMFEIYMLCLTKFYFPLLPKENIFFFYLSDKFHYEDMIDKDRFSVGYRFERERFFNDAFDKLL
jgi:hypothetical protein